MPVRTALNGNLKPLSNLLVFVALIAAFVLFIQSQAETKATEAIENHNSDVMAHQNMQAQLAEMKQEIKDLRDDYLKYTTIEHPKQVREAEDHIVDRILSGLGKR